MINKMQTGLTLFIVLLLIAVPSHNLWGQDSAQGKIVSVNGMEMYYEIHGQGEPLVLLHGFAESSQGWIPFIEDFSKHFQLIIPDLRGHGRSTNPNPTEIFSIRQAAQDVLALLDHLDITEFKTIGLSLGAVTSLHMSVLQPERVDAQVLVGGTTHFPEECRNIMRNMPVEMYPEAAWEYYRKIHKNGDEQIRLLLSQFSKFADSYDDTNFTPQDLSIISAKVLIVHGDRDAYIPVSIPAEMHKSIPKSYLWIRPNAGHVPILGRSDKSNSAQTVLEFLRGMWEKKR